MHAVVLFALLCSAQCPGGVCPPPMTVRGPFGSQVIAAPAPTPASRPAFVAPQPSPRRRFGGLLRRRCR